MYRLVLVLSVLFLASEASAISESDLDGYLDEKRGYEREHAHPGNAYDGSISGLCRDRWNNDYEMQEYCENNQHRAKERMRGRSNALCSERWGNDYEMYEYCDNNQEGARRRLGR